MAAAPPKGGGNILTRKLGPLPGWAWAAIGVAGYLVYRQRQAAKAAAGATTTAATTSTAATTPVAQAPSGYEYQGPGNGGNYGYQVPTGAMAATAGATPAANTPPASGTPAYSQVATPQEGAALQASGVPIYVGGFQGLPNQYVPFQAGVQYPTGTSEYVQNQ